MTLLKTKIKWTNTIFFRIKIGGRFRAMKDFWIKDSEDSARKILYPKQNLSILGIAFEISRNFRVLTINSELKEKDYTPSQTPPNQFSCN